MSCCSWSMEWSTLRMQVELQRRHVMLGGHPAVEITDAYPGAPPGRSASSTDGRLATAEIAVENNRPG
jgi:hypothetical protein